MTARLAADARPLIASAEAQARTRMSPSIEAEHLLLALADARATDAGGVLADAGLSRTTIDEALDREFAASLSVAGVRVDVASLGVPSREPQRTLRLGASFRSAMERSVAAAAGSRRVRPAHLLLGVLGAEVGTVPRALDLAGVDRGDLEQRTREALAG
jgi:ATP-dependent Clp protease ATP-binding subunit ClpA